MPDWAIVVLSLLGNSVWIVPFLKIMIDAGVEERKRKKDELERTASWNKSHPDKTRLLCIKCKYCRTKTYSAFRNYGMPLRYPMYCRLLKKDLQPGGMLDSYTTLVRCIIPEPSDEFIEREEVVAPPDGMIYFSPNSGCYHYSPYCPSLRSARTIYHEKLGSYNFEAFARRPCSRCCIHQQTHSYTNSTATAAFPSAPPTQVHSSQQPADSPAPAQRSTIIKMKPVVSSNVESIGFYNSTLYVCFHNGSVYRYSDVPAEEFFSLLNASSVGKRFNTAIRDCYEGEYIGGKGDIPPALTQPAATIVDERTHS